MGVKTQLAMIAALGFAALMLLRWSPNETVKVNYSSSVRGLLGEGGKGTLKCTMPSPKPPVSIEWTGRESMTVSYKEGVDVEVYKHEFPGSTLCACGGGVRWQARRRLWAAWPVLSRLRLLRRFSSFLPLSRFYITTTLHTMAGHQTLLCVFFCRA
jgi:hypothetical protein